MVEIIPFPLERYVGKARHVAAMIDRRRGKDREAYYRAICRQMADRLRRLGVAEPDVQRLIIEFTDTVNQCLAEGWHFPGDETAPAAQGARQPDLFTDHGPGAA